MREQDLVEGIYEAALDPKGWTDCLQAFEEMLCGAALLSLSHPGAGDPGAVFAPSLDPDFVQSYRRRYYALDPLRLDPPARSADRFDRVPRGISAPEIRRTPFFREWVEPQGLLPGPWLGAVLDHDASEGVALLAIFKPRGARRTGEAERRLAERLLPHLGRAARIYFRVAQVEQRERGLASAIDRLPVGLVLIDGRGQVQTTNRAAKRILASRKGLELTREGLRVVEGAEEAEKLARLTTAATGPEPGRSALPVGALRLPRRGHRALEVLVTGLPGTQREDASALAAVFLCDPEQELVAEPNLLRCLFDLTPAEAALAHALANGCSLSEAADGLGIALGTVRQRLQQVFEKTQTGRQSELMRLLLRGPAALVTDD